MDNYDYFGDKGQKLGVSEGKTQNDYLTNENYTITDKPIEYVPRDRLLSRQSFSQNQVVQGQNKSIVLNDGTSDRLIIGYSKNAF